MGLKEEMIDMLNEDIGERLDEREIGDVPNYGANAARATRPEVPPFSPIMMEKHADGMRNMRIVALDRAISSFVGGYTDGALISRAEAIYRFILGA